MTDSQEPGHQGVDMGSPATLPKGSPGAEPATSYPSGFARKPAEVTFDAVYEAHFDFVWRSVRRLGVDESGVDDVVQEVFFTAHKRLSDFEGRSSVRTWLFAIVVQFVRHYRRTRQRKQMPVARSGPEHDPDTIADARQPGPLEAAERRDDVRLLDALLQELDDDKREVFVLTELAQMTAVEIAEVLGASINTVYSRLRAARQDFERALARHRAREARRAP
jgi:RNA polymerase sigma-70 factor (ECF subfamily)